MLPLNSDRNRHHHKSTTTSFNEGNQMEEKELYYH
jgi:hypothetical protein